LFKLSTGHLCSIHFSQRQCEGAIKGVSCAMRDEFATGAGRFATGAGRIVDLVGVSVLS